MKLRRAFRIRSAGAVIALATLTLLFLASCAPVHGERSTTPPPLGQYRLTVTASPSGIWYPSGSGWYTEGTTVWTPTAPAERSKTTYGARTTHTRYTFTTWKKDFVPVAGNPISVLMNGPHTITAAYWGCEMISVTWDADTETVRFHITAGDTRNVRFFATLEGPVNARYDLFSGVFPGGADITTGNYVIPTPYPGETGWYKYAVRVEDVATLTELTSSYMWIEWV